MIISAYLLCHSKNARTHLCLADCVKDFLESFENFPQVCFEFVILDTTVGLGDGPGETAFCMWVTDCGHSSKPVLYGSDRAKEESPCNIIFPAKDNNDGPYLNHKRENSMMMI